MLKRFEVENFRNFKNRLVLDFTKVGGYQFNSECITDNMIGKMLVYGRNATGKTNLCRAILDIAASISGTVRIQPGMWLNADSEKEYAEYMYVFQFGEDEVSYCYKRKSQYMLLEEELRVNSKLVFYFNFETKQGSFDNLQVLGAETVVIERYLEAVDDASSEETEETRSLPFLRWIISNTMMRGDSILLELYSYVKRMTVLTVSASTMYQPGKYYDSFYERLADGEKLADFEEFLNVMGVDCKLRLITLPDGRKELYFDHETPVPFGSSASSGTLALMNLYSRLMIGKETSLLCIDEFDAFYHYEMSEIVVRFFKKKYPKCQVIMTTHNTNLMTNKLMRPDCLFILSGDGRLTALCDATERELREGHNLEKLYISGEFDKYE